MPDALIKWGPHADPGCARDGMMDWSCRCGAELTVSWRTFASLYDDDPITPEGSNTATWQVECHAGHVLLTCFELADDETADTFDAPTTAQIVVRLADPDEIPMWRDHVTRERIRREARGDG